MAHTTDVEGLRQSMTPEEFDGWLAYDRLEPIGPERLIEVLKLGFAAICGAWGADLEPDSFDPLRPDAADEDDADEAEPDPETEQARIELEAAAQIDRVFAIVARHNGEGA